jgi:hypothetical protein
MDDVAVSLSELVGTIVRCHTERAQNHVLRWATPDRRT